MSLLASELLLNRKISSIARKSRFCHERVARLVLQRLSNMILSFGGCGCRLSNNCCSLAKSLLVLSEKVAKPNNDFACSTVNLPHHLHLLAFLIGIGLIDTSTDSVDQDRFVEAVALCRNY